MTASPTTTNKPPAHIIQIAKAVAKGCRDPEVLRVLVEYDASQLIDAGQMPSWFHSGQREAWGVTERIALLLWGHQSGKTIYGPEWLLREIQFTASEGEANDYLLAGPTIELLKKKALPSLKRRLAGIAEYNSSDRCFRFTPAGVKMLTGYENATITIFVGYATKPESLESATYRGAWLDEAGQDDFKLDSWEAIMRRLAIHQGRVLITTTPYNLGWLKTNIYDKEKPGYIKVVKFESIQNPTYPRAEWERAMEELPEWKFDLFYRGIFTRPVGLVYDCFDGRNLVKFKDFFPDSMLPREWPVWVGIDFGQTNCAIVLIAEEMQWDELREEWLPMPHPRFCMFKNYRCDTPRTALDHMREAFRGMGKDMPLMSDDGHVQMSFKVTRDQIIAYGGAHGESGWRELFALSGLMVNEPVISGGKESIAPQVQTVWTALKTKRLLICEHLQEVRADFAAFSYEVDAEGNRLEKFKDEHLWHSLAAIRYVVPGFFRSEFEEKPPPPGAKPVTAYG